MVSTCWGSSKGTHHLVLVLSKGTHNLPSSRWVSETKRLGNWTRNSPWVGLTTTSPLLLSGRVCPAEPPPTRGPVVLKLTTRTSPRAQGLPWGSRAVASIKAMMIWHLRTKQKSISKLRRASRPLPPVAHPICSLGGKLWCSSKKPTRQPSNRSPKLDLKDPLVGSPRDRQSMYTHYGRSNPTLKINFYECVYMKNLNIVVFDFNFTKF